MRHIYKIQPGNRQTDDETDSAVLAVGLIFPFGYKILKTVSRNEGSFSRNLLVFYESID